jgi:hypothetical protein
MILAPQTWRVRGVSHESYLGSALINANRAQKKSKDASKKQAKSRKMSEIRRSGGIRQRGELHAVPRYRSDKLALFLRYFALNRVIRSMKKRGNHSPRFP